MKKNYLLIVVYIVLSCNQQSKSSDNPQSFYSTSTDQDGISWDTNESYVPEDEITDGTYCAEVEYYNPNTGTRSTYELDVEVEDGYLIQINWPNGGWLDETHFTSEDITSGECGFTSDRGYRYTVVLGEKGGNCYSDGYRLQNRVNEDTENITCPKCGNEKDEYEDYCDDCSEEVIQEEEGVEY